MGWEPGKPPDFSGDGEWEKWKRLSLATKAYLQGHLAGSDPALNFAFAELARFIEGNEGRKMFSAPTLTHNREVLVSQVQAAAERALANLGTQQS